MSATAPEPGATTAADGDTGVNPTTGGGSAGGDTSEVPDDGGSTGGPAVCGDGVVAADEACDDGANNGAGEACRPGCVLNVCGDGDQGPAEACDAGAANGPDDACSATCEVNPSACGTIVISPTIEKEPLDVIFVIDNSGSMLGEIQGIQDNINANFAAILDAAGLDTTVVVVSRYSGTASMALAGVCIEAPLGEIPAGACDDPPADPGNTATFSHYSTTIGSTNAWCKILETGVGVLDEFDHYGWIKWLRKEAFKAFIIVSDDAADCTWDSLLLYDNQVDAHNLEIAEKFDAALRTKSPTRFGALDGERRYTVHSLVGLAAADDGEPYGPTDPTILATCPTASEPGAGHQALSKLTGGLRFPVCDTNNYEKVFQALADSMIKSAKLACEFAFPAAPDGKSIDPASVAVHYHAMGDPNYDEPFAVVADALECGAGGFYIEGGTIHLCPSTCAEVQADALAQLEVEFKCLPVIPG